MIVALVIKSDTCYLLTSETWQESNAEGHILYITPNLYSTLSTTPCDAT